MQLTQFLFVGLAAASAHRHRRDGGYGGYGGGYPALNSTSAASTTVDAVPTSSPSSLAYPSGTGVSTDIVVVSPSPISSDTVVAPTGTAPFTPSFTLGTGASSVEAPTGVPYPSSSPAGTGAVPYPSSSLVATGVEAPSSAGTVPSSVVAPINTDNGYPTAYFPTITPTTELGPDTSTITDVVTKTLTYTVGKSTNLQVVTTTYKVTSTKYVCESVTVTNPADFPTPTAETAVAAAASSSDSTTTIKSTRTHTVVKTVYAETSTPTGVATAVAAASSGECAAPVYVTVTAKETVTVTATAGYESTAESAVAAAVTSPSSSVEAVVSATATSTQVVYIIPSPASSVAATGPPYGNGTVVYPTGGAPSGFLTFSKPVDKPTGTGASTALAPISTGGAPYGGYRT